MQELYGESLERVTLWNSESNSRVELVERRSAGHIAQRAAGDALELVAAERLSQHAAQRGVPRRALPALLLNKYNHAYNSDNHYRSKVQNSRINRILIMKILNENLRKRNVENEAGH